MKSSKDTQNKSSSAWATLLLCAGCVGYILFEQWLFLIGGLLGFTLISALKE